MTTDKNREAFVTWLESIPSMTDKVLAKFVWEQAQEPLLKRIAELEANTLDGAKVRNAALDEAAKACDELHHTWRFDDEPDSASGPMDCAAAIRALQSAPPSPSTEEGGT